VVSLALLSLAVTAALVLTVQGEAALILRS